MVPMISTSAMVNVSVQEINVMELALLDTSNVDQDVNRTRTVKFQLIVAIFVATARIIAQQVIMILIFFISNYCVYCLDNCFSTIAFLLAIKLDIDCRSSIYNALNSIVLIIAV